LLWKYPAEAQNGMMFFAAPTIYDGKIYAGTYQNEVHILNQNDGTLITKIALETNKNKILASPVIADDMLFIASNNGSVYAYALADLNAPVWQTDLSTEIWGSPFVSDGKVYVTTRQTIPGLDEKHRNNWKTLSINGAVMGRWCFRMIRSILEFGERSCLFQSDNMEIESVCRPT
jgi:outer membrane protein assembly factor BamB